MPTSTHRIRIRAALLVAVAALLCVDVLPYHATPVLAQDAALRGEPVGETVDQARPVSDILQSRSPLDQRGRVDAAGVSPIIRRITTGKGLVGVLLAFALSFLGVVALLVLVMAGFRYITAFGGDTAKAKQAIVGVIIGIIVILGAWALVTTLINFGAGPPI